MRPREIGLITAVELTSEQAAEILGISHALVHHRMDTGRLPFRREGAERRVLQSDVLALKRFEDERREFAAEIGADTDDQTT